MTDRSLGSVSSIPPSPQTPHVSERGGETEPSDRRVTEPYYCKDCGRRFFNLGWHAEACGSPNFERMADYWERLAKLKEARKRLVTGK